MPLLFIFRRKAHRNTLHGQRGMLTSRPLCGNRAASHYQALGGGIKGLCRGRCPPDGPTWPPTLGHSFRPGQGLREPRSGREPDGGWGVVWRGPGREPTPPPAPSAQVTPPASALGVNVLRGTARRGGCGLPGRGASTGDEALFQCTKPSGVPRGPSHLQFP